MPTPEDSRKESRNTRQKRLILDILDKYGSNHMSAEELFERIRASDEQISIATVYRNLRLLEQQGVVRKVYVSDDAVAYYEATGNADEHSHHHLICRRCGAIYDFEVDLLEALEKMIERTKGFTVEDHRVAFYGVCKACRERDEKERAASGTELETEKPGV